MKKSKRFCIVLTVMFFFSNVLADSKVAVNKLKKIQLVTNVIHIANNLFNHPVQQKMENGTRTIFLNMMAKEPQKANIPEVSNLQKKSDDFKLEQDKIRSNFNNNIENKKDCYTFTKLAGHKVKIFFIKNGIKKELIISNYKLGKLIVAMNEEYANYLLADQSLSDDDKILRNALMLSNKAQAIDNAESQGLNLFGQFLSNLGGDKLVLTADELKNKAIEQYKNNKKDLADLGVYFKSQNYKKKRGCEIYHNIKIKHPGITESNFYDFNIHLTDEEKVFLEAYLKTSKKIIFMSKSSQLKEQLYSEQDLNFMKAQYLELMKNNDSHQGPVLWGGHIELNAIAEKYNICIKVIYINEYGEKNLVTPIGDVNNPEIIIQLQGGHYKYINAAGEEVNVPGDGNCMFNAVLGAAVSNGILTLTSKNVAQLRAEVVGFLQENSDLMASFSPDEIVDGIYKFKEIIDIFTVTNNPSKTINLNNKQSKQFDFKFEPHKVKSNFAENKKHIINEEDYYIFGKIGGNKIEILFTENGMVGKKLVSKYMLGKLILSVNKEYADYLYMDHNLSEDDKILLSALKFSIRTQSKDNIESKGSQLFNYFLKTIGEKKLSFTSGELKEQALKKFSNIAYIETLDAYFKSQSYKRMRGFEVHSKHPDITEKNIGEQDGITDEDKEFLAIYFMSSSYQNKFSNKSHKKSYCGLFEKENGALLGEKLYKQDASLLKKLLIEKKQNSLDEIGQEQLIGLQMYMLDSRNKLQGKYHEIMKDVYSKPDAVSKNIVSLSDSLDEKEKDEEEKIVCENNNNNNNNNNDNYNDNHYVASNIFDDEYVDYIRFFEYHDYDI